MTPSMPTIRNYHGEEDALEGTLKTPVVYPAAVMKSGKHPEAAKKFLEFLRTPECAKVFEAVGFAVVR